LLNQGGGKPRPYNIRLGVVLFPVFLEGLANEVHDIVELVECRHATDCSAKNIALNQKVKT
jgi:hypothetical protein